MMQQYGQNIVPLSVVGMFLNYCGNHFLHFVHHIMKRKIFFPSHRVVGIQLLQNGEILTVVQRRSFTIKRIDGQTHVKFAKHDQLVQFRSKAIIVSNGARQTLHPQFFESWFPFL